MDREKLLYRILEAERNAQEQVEALQRLDLASDENDLETERLISESFFILSIQQMKIAIAKARHGIIGNNWYNKDE